MSTSAKVLASVFSEPDGTTEGVVVAVEVTLEVFKTGTIPMCSHERDLGDKT